MVRISKRIMKSCKKMTDFYVRIVNVPKMKTIELQVTPIVFFQIEDMKMSDGLTEQLEFKLVFLKKIYEIPLLVDEIPDLCEAVYDEVIVKRSEIFISTTIYPRTTYRNTRTFKWKDHTQTIRNRITTSVKNKKQNGSIIHISTK